MNAACKTPTPPQIARRYGVSPEKVRLWIERGELRAINVAARANGRPRFVVNEADLAASEAMRSAPREPATLRRRRRANVIEFF